MEKLLPCTIYVPVDIKTVDDTEHIYLSFILLGGQPKEFIEEKKDVYVFNKEELKSLLDTTFRAGATKRYEYDQYTKFPDTSDKTYKETPTVEQFISSLID